MRRWLDACERALTFVAVVATFAMMLLTTADALGRYVFNRPILVAYELTTNYLVVAAVFLAMPYAYREGANIRVTFLVERLGRPVRQVIDHLVQLASMAYCALLVYATIQQTLYVRSTGTLFTTVEIPLWPGHAVVAIGLFLATLMMFLDLGRVRSGRSPLFADG
jgi:TRAP-type C4-dicarboxylate transport system permease small subunit